MIQQKLAPYVDDARWLASEGERADYVDLYRDYYEGRHRLKLTAEMRRMMQISDSRSDRYNANYAKKVVNAMADRLILNGIQCGNDEAQAWVDGVLTDNRLDGLQMDVHQAALRDGITYVMCETDNEGRTTIAHERAFDGYRGVISVWDSTGNYILAAAKVWHDLDGVERVNVYYPNRVDKWQVVEVENAKGRLVREMVEYAPAEMLERNGINTGVPIVAFVNNEKPHGASELVDVIPLQDSLNRQLISMVMSGEFAAFSIMLAKGFSAPAALTPGMIIEVLAKNSDGNAVMPEDDEMAKALANYYGTVSLDRIEGGSLEQYIKAMDFIIEQIGTVTDTPLPGVVGGGNSGEYLKQLEVGLLGKVRRAQVSFGNSWEDVIYLVYRQHLAYASQTPPMLEGCSARWRDAQVRNDAEIMSMANQLHQMGYEREALRVLGQSSLINWSENDIERIIDEKMTDVARSMRGALAQVNGFEGFAPLG